MDGAGDHPDGDPVFRHRDVGIGGRTGPAVRVAETDVERPCAAEADDARALARIVLLRQPGTRIPPAWPITTVCVACSTQTSGSVGSMNLLRPALSAISISI